MNKRVLRVLALAIALVAASCSASDDVAESELAPAVPAPVVLAPAPQLSPGAVTTGSVVISGTTIDFAVFVPAGFAVDDLAPVLLAFPPGGQTLALAQGVVESTYAPQAGRFGWVVISPAAPDGQLFFEGSETLMPGFVDWVQSWVFVEGGAPHVAGISNGGISAFRFATQNPRRVRSLIVLPGFPRSDQDQAALADLTNVPIRMFVGGTDTAWIGPAEQTVATVEELGGDIELTIFEGEGHILNATADGVLIFEQLQSVR